MALSMDPHDDWYSSSLLPPTFKQNPMNLNFYKLQLVPLTRAAGGQFIDLSATCSGMLVLKMLYLLCVLHRAIGNNDWVKLV